MQKNNYRTKNGGGIKMVNLNIQIKDSLWQKFKNICLQQKKTRKQKVTELIMRCVNHQDRLTQKRYGEAIEQDAIKIYQEQQIKEG